MLALASVILALGAGPLLPEKFSGRRPKLPRQPWQTRAVARARSVVLALGAGPSGFPKQFSGRRPKLLRQPPRARFRRFGAGGWPDGLPETSDESGGILDGQWPQWPFYQPGCQICQFGLRMADFILSRIRSLSAAKPSHFYQGLAEWQLYQGRPAAVAVYQSRWQLYQGWPAYGRFIKNGRFIKIEDQPQWPFYQSEACKWPDL